MVVVAVMVSLVFSAAAIAAAGALDPTFSGDGKQTTQFASGTSSAAAAARQPDGKIVAVGRVDNSTNAAFAIARYNPNGSLDTTFSGDGKQTTNFGGGSGATGVAIQADGKIVAVGSSPDNFGDFALARYNPNGSLDTSFSGDGKQTTNFGASDLAHGVALQQDGKIVVVGAGVGDDFAIARYNPNGSLDTSFSEDGKQRTDFGGSDEATGVAVQGDGKIVAVGAAPDLQTNTDFALARYNPNGSLDTSFSGDGKQRTNFGGPDGASAVALYGDGRMVVVGVGRTGMVDGFAIARYNPHGSLDTSFSGDGRQVTDFGGSDFARAGALQPNGKIVAVGGTSTSAVNDFALARYNPNGSLDTSFSGDGKQTTSFSPGCCDGASGVVLLPNGKIVAVGTATGIGGFALARYLGS